MQETEKQYGESGYTPNLSDFAFFMAVMKDRRAHRNILSIILDENDLKLLDVKVEQVVLNERGKRAIRMDAWALDSKKRQINTELQNDTEKDSVRKRSRFYQSIMDTPILKAGKNTKYRHLPETIVIFITQEDIFRKNLAQYTFTEQCEEVQGLHLEDGTRKIFLNMSSKNGRPELISLLQYMKETTIDNPEIIVKDERITELNAIVQEMKETEEWETMSSSIYKQGITQGISQGINQGIQKNIQTVIRNMLNRGMSEEDICAIAECTPELIEKVRAEMKQTK